MMMCSIAIARALLKMQPCRVRLSQVQECSTVDPSPNRKRKRNQANVSPLSNKRAYESPVSETKVSLHKKQPKRRWRSDLHKHEEMEKCNQCTSADAREV